MQTSITEEEAGKKEKQAKDVKRAERKTTNRLHQHLAEQGRLEAVNMDEQETVKRINFEGYQEFDRGCAKFKEQLRVMVAYKLC